jgi:hypothetical protein
MHVVERYDISELEPYLREILLEDRADGGACKTLPATEFDEMDAEAAEFDEIDADAAEFDAMDADAAELDALDDADDVDEVEAEAEVEVADEA